MAPRAPTSTETTVSEMWLLIGHGVELDVVDAHDLAAVDVDDLLIEEIALQEQHAVRRDVALPLGGVRVAALTVALHDFTDADRQHAFAVGCSHDQVDDARGMFLRARRRFRAHVREPPRWRRGRRRRAVPKGQSGT